MSRVTIVIARIRGNITPCITTHKPTSSRGGLVISGISVQPHSRAPPGFRKPRHLADCVFRHVMRFTNAWALASERSSLRWDGPELAVCPVQLEHGATLSCRGLELSAASRHVQVRRGFLRSCMSAPLSLTRSSVPAATLQEREMYIRLPRTVHMLSTRRSNYSKAEIWLRVEACRAGRGLQQPNPRDAAW